MNTCYDFCTVMDEPGLAFIFLSQALVMHGAMDLRSVNCDLIQVLYTKNSRIFLNIHVFYIILSFGSQLNYQHWQEGEPNNHNNDESCTEFRSYHWDESGSWNDVNCESYNDWLCQIRAGTVRK